MPVDEYCKQMRFLFVLMGNVNDRYDLRICVNLIGLQFGIWVNVASGELRGSSYDTNFYIIKNFGYI